LISAKTLILFYQRCYPKKILLRSVDNICMLVPKEKITWYLQGGSFNIASKLFFNFNE